MSRRSEICPPNLVPTKALRINFRAPVYCARDSEPEKLAETEGFEPSIRL